MNHCQHSCAQQRDSLALTISVRQVLENVFHTHYSDFFMFHTLVPTNFRFSCNEPSIQFSLSFHKIVPKSVLVGCSELFKDFIFDSTAKLHNFDWAVHQFLSGYEKFAELQPPDSTDCRLPLSTKRRAPYQHFCLHTPSHILNSVLLGALATHLQPCMRENLPQTSR